MSLKISGGRSLKGSPALPGDKSISHRALMCGALAEGTSEIVGLNRCADVLSTLGCFAQLGVEIEDRGGVLRMEGRGLYGVREPTDVLDAGNSGTTLRILPGILAAQPFFCVLTGDESLRRRPMERVINPLRIMGAQIWGRANGTRAPLASWGSELYGAQILTEIPSAQVKSAVLFAGLLADGQTEVVEPAPSRDHTERMMSYLGAELAYQPGRARVKGKVPLQGGRIEIPADISAAAFFMVAATLLPESELIVRNVGANPGRTGLVEMLYGMGAAIEVLEEREAGNEPVADLAVRHAPLQALSVGGELIPRLIDEIPILAVAATQAEGVTEITGAEELRVKESDRISVLVQELRKLGARIEERPDGMAIEGPTSLKGARCSSHGDHRIAMALAVAGLVAEGETEIEGDECVSVSFPGFAQALEPLLV